MTTPIQYKGRVWTCDAHNLQIEAMISNGETKDATRFVNLLHPKKGNICTECARLYDITPPCNR